MGSVQITCQLHKQFNCRPNDFLLLETPHAKTKYGRKTFAYNGPRYWNALPLNMRVEDDVEKFKCQLKTMLFTGFHELKRRAFKYG